MAMVNVADGGGKSVSINKVANNVKKPAVQPISKTVIKTPPININDKLRKGGVTTGGGNTSNTSKNNIFDQIKNDPTKGIVGGGTKVQPKNISEATGSIGVTNYLNTPNNAHKPKTTKEDFERMVGLSQNSTSSHSSTLASTGCGSVKTFFKTSGCTSTAAIKGTAVSGNSSKSTIKGIAATGCAAHTTVTTGCSGVKTADIKNKKVEIPLKTSDGKKLSKKATGFLKDGAAIVASGALAGPAGVAVATTVVAGKTLVANAPALRENANKAKQIAQDLLSGLKKSQQTLDTLHDKWQGSDANKYIESTRERLKNLEVISQVMELYQKTSEQAAKKVEEAKDFVTNAVDRMNSGGGSASF